MKVIDMIILYEKLVRENFSKTYRIHRQGKQYTKHKESMRKLKKTLDHKDIDIESFIRVQFGNKGHKPFPAQFNGKAAMNRWEQHYKLDDARELHRMQESYLVSFLEAGYTVEEALAFDVFYYYFRCMKLIDYPKIWRYYAECEIERIPGLKRIYVLM